MAYTNELTLEIIVDGVHRSLKIPLNVLIEITESIPLSWFLEVSLHAKEPLKNTKVIEFVI